MPSVGSLCRFSGEHHLDDQLGGLAAQFNQIFLLSGDPRRLVLVGCLEKFASLVHPSKKKKKRKRKRKRKIKKRKERKQESSSVPCVALGYHSKRKIPPTRSLHCNGMDNDWVGFFVLFCFVWGSSTWPQPFSLF